VSAEPNGKPVGGDPVAGRLRIDGQAIERLTLVDEHDRSMVLERPGTEVSLAPDKYQVEKIELQGGFHCYSYADSEDDWLHVAPGKTPVLKAGAPLKSTVEVSRRGRVLTLDYSLVDAAGHKYVKQDRNQPPKFTVTRNGQSTGSGSFEFG
jgi:hypothetical protein